MDQQTFDRLARAVAAGQSRRAFLRRAFGVGTAALGGLAAESALAGPIVTPGVPNSTVPLHEPSEPGSPVAVPASTTNTPSDPNAICLEPLQTSECGCLDPATQLCCQDAICTGVCTDKDGCCNVSSDKNQTSRGEVCGDHCCHPHLDPANSDYSECCDQSCCAGHCYGENLCCAVDRFCPGAGSDLCCDADERCCGAGTANNACIPGGEGSCCSVDDCAATADACYVSCDAGFCRQHICSADAVCCADGTGNVACVAGNCCGDGDCAAGEACLAGTCATVECLSDGDCAAADACSVATCSNGACHSAPLCAGACATCADGICSTDDTLCGLCGACNAGACVPVTCPDGYACYEATGECLGIA